MTTKRRVALASAAAVFLAMVFLVAQLRPAPPRATGPWEEAVVEGEGADKVAIVPVRGEIVDVRGPAEVAAADEVVSQLRQAGEDDAVKAVVLHLNTPGGSVVASARIHEAVEDLREDGKPVVAWMGEVAASGGYYVSTAADRIVADPSTLTGSIGTILVLLNLQEAAGKLGVQPIVLTAGRLKGLGSPFRELSREERDILERLIQESYDRFVGVVADGRDLPVAEVRELADGRPLSGQQAEGLELVDELGGFDEAVRAARELGDLERATVVEYRRPFSLRDILGRGWPGLESPVEGLERSVGATGPLLKYLYVS